MTSRDCGSPTFRRRIARPNWAGTAIHDIKKTAAVQTCLAKTEITADSKFQVTLEIPKTALPSSDPSLVKTLAEKVSVHIAKTSRWAPGQAGTLTYKTMHAIEGLDKNAKPSSELKSILGIILTGLDEAGKSLVGSLEKLSRLGDTL